MNAYLKTEEGVERRKAGREGQREEGKRERKREWVLNCVCRARCQAGSCWASVYMLQIRKPPCLRPGPCAKVLRSMVSLILSPPWVSCPPTAIYTHLYSVAADRGGLQRPWKLGSQKQVPLLPTLTRYAFRISEAWVTSPTASRLGRSPQGVRSKAAAL